MDIINIDVDFNTLHGHRNVNVKSWVYILPTLRNAVDAAQGLNAPLTQQDLGTS